MKIRTLMMMLVLMTPIFAASLDPCVEAREKFQQQKTGIGNSSNAVAAKLYSAEGRKQILDSFWKEARKHFEGALAKQGYDHLDPKVLDLLFAKWVKNNGGEAKVNEQVLAAFDTNTKRQIHELENAVQAKQHELENACPMDAGSQFVRITLGGFNNILANFSGAQRENDPVSQLLRFTTGVSVKDILDKGVFGGDNSFFNHELGVKTFLDQLGPFNPARIPGLPGGPGFPGGLPGLPGLPGIPGLPNLPVPGLSGLHL